LKRRRNCRASHWSRKSVAFDPHCFADALCYRQLDAALVVLGLWIVQFL